MADRVAIESIEKVYYQGEDFDVIKHELQVRRSLIILTHCGLVTP